jgi:hypothetical protein
MKDAQINNVVRKEDRMESTKVRSVSSARLRHSAAAAVFLFALLGCSYGRLVLLPRGQDNIETFVEERYGTVDASYSGTMEKPGALRFDIKDDGGVLTGSGWQPLESKDEILEIVQNMQATYRKYKGALGARGPMLYAIMDKENQLIGYVYSPLDTIPVRTDGENYKLDAITEVDVRNLENPIMRRSRNADGMGGSSSSF